MRGIWSIVLSLLLVLPMGEAWAEIAGINSAINKAGRQRMLSQRMAKYYLAQTWGIGDAASAAEIDRARQEFEEAQRELDMAVINTPRIKGELDVAKQQWIFFLSALDPRTIRDRRAAVVVASSSERILEAMENVVGLYERVGGR